MTIGLGIVTYSRPDYLKQCINTVLKNNNGGAQHVVIGIDFKDEETSKTLEDIAKTYAIPTIRFPQNVGVGANKNGVLKYLKSMGCTEFFVMEDDILMANPNVCKHYINEAKRLGTHHMNFALHGPMNVGHKHNYTFENGAKGFVYPNCVGAFSYYSSTFLEQVGLFDEKFFNAWEHVEHSFRGCLKNLTPPFWYFADHPTSHLLLQEIPGSIDHSSIRPRLDWQANIKQGQEYWVHKHGMWLPPFPEKFYKGEQ